MNDKKTPSAWSNSAVIPCPCKTKLATNAWPHQICGIVGCTHVEVSPESPAYLFYWVAREFRNTSLPKWCIHVHSLQIQKALINLAGRDSAKARLPSLRAATSLSSHLCTCCTHPHFAEISSILDSTPWRHYLLPTNLPGQNTIDRSDEFQLWDGTAAVGIDEFEDC